MVGLENTRVKAAEALSRLQAGNERFVRNLPRAARPEDEVSRLAREGQRPWAVVAGCADSRVPPELIFDCGLGELFVVRTAGAVLTEVELGSIEYAVTQLGAALVLVLGHSGCGAVAAALSGEPQQGHLGRLLQEIAPAVAAAGGIGCPSRVEDAHILRMGARLRADPVLEGAAVFCGKYETATGRVCLLEHTGA